MTRLATRPVLLASRRRQLEDAVERALAALDALDGDPDFEDQCEDEGAQCEDEGSFSDYEASLCGVTFGRGDHTGLDCEITGAPFVMDHRIEERAI